MYTGYWGKQTAWKSTQCGSRVDGREQGIRFNIFTGLEHVIRYNVFTGLEHGIRYDVFTELVQSVIWV